MSETEKFHQAQVAYDYREPPEDCDEGHSWRRVRSDGEMTLYRCRVCGKEEVS